MVNSVNLKIDKESLLKGTFTLSVIGILFALTGSSLIASVLGTSAAKVGQVLTIAYRAYKAGSSIRTAISAAMGPGAAIGFLVSVVAGYGFSAILGSPGFKSW